MFLTFTNAKGGGAHAVRDEADTLERWSLLAPLAGDAVWSIEHRADVVPDRDES